MKKEIHPSNYRTVAFKDVSADKIFLLESTANTSEEIKIGEKKYPLFTIDTSSASHAFYTGSRSTAKSTGQVEKFNKRFSAGTKAK